MYCTHMYIRVLADIRDFRKLRNSLRHISWSYMNIYKHLFTKIIDIPTIKTMKDFKMTFYELFENKAE